jgi:hypothetical protein
MWYYRRPLIFGRGDAIGAWFLPRRRGGVPWFTDALSSRSPGRRELIKSDQLGTVMTLLAADRSQLARISIKS